MERLEREILARLDIADPYAARDEAGSTPDDHARHRSQTQPSSCSRPRRSSRATCRCRCAPRRARRRELVPRVLRALFGWKTGSIRADLENVLEAATPAKPASRRKRAPCSRISSALRERRIDDVMVPRADIVAVQQDISLGELVKVFESAGHSRLVVYNDTLDDPGRHGAHPRPDRLHDRARRGRAGKASQAQEAAAGRPRSRRDRSVDAAVGDQNHARDPVRAAVDAGDRSARQDAGDAHPSGAGDRRIRRHRRPGVDRGHRRADRRRHRGRARRRRASPPSCASPTARSRRRARQPRRRRAASARNSTSARPPKRSIRSAVIS